MPLLEVMVLALIQALTEFLPISSSAHLFLAARLFGHGYQGLTFDLGLHLGTLLAVLVYFRQQWRELLLAGARWRPGMALDAEQRLLLGIALATAPAALVGLAMSRSEGLAEALRHDTLIGINLIVFGVILWIADRYFGKQAHEHALSIGQIMLIGCAQALALVPGVSRSGITMSAGLFLGLSRESAARFSFLLAVPVTSLAAAKGVVDMARGGEALDWRSFALGAGLSAVFGWVVIYFFLGLIRRVGVLPFSVYRVILGLGLLFGLV